MANYELRIETSEMRKALDVLATVTPRKSMLPILSDACVRYDRERKLFTMEASNTEQFMVIECWKADEKADGGRRAWMFHDSHGKGDDKTQPLTAFCIDVALFREAFDIPSMPATCYLELNDDGSGTVRVTYGKGEFTLPVQSAAEFPVIPQVVEKDGEHSGTISPVVKFSMETSKILPDILSSRVCSANDELRPVLNTVCVDCFHDHAIVVASDGHSLFRKGIDTGMGWLRYGEFPADSNMKVLIPKEALAPLQKALGSSDSITLTADTMRICIESADGIIKLITRAVDGNYPNYESVIPRDQKFSLLIDRQDLRVTLRRMSLFSEEASNMCILRYEDEILSLLATDNGRGRNSSEQVTVVSSEGDTPEKFEIGCKISTLTQLLDCIGTDNLMVNLSEPNQPIILKEDAQLSSLTLLVMPMLVQ